MEVFISSLFFHFLFFPRRAVENFLGYYLLAFLLPISGCVLQQV